MNTSVTDIDQQVAAAWAIGHSTRFPQVIEHIEITLSTHKNYQRDGKPFGFVRMGNIPERFHSFIYRVSLGSSVPAPDDRRDAFWEYDIDRWLRSIGVETIFVMPEAHVN